MLTETKQLPFVRPTKELRASAQPIDRWALSSPAAPLKDSNVLQWVLEHGTILWPNCQPLAEMNPIVWKQFNRLWNGYKGPEFNGQDYLRLGSYSLHLSRHGHCLTVRKGNKFGRFIDLEGQGIDWPKLAQGFKDLGYVNLPFPSSAGAVAAYLLASCQNISHEEVPDDVAALAWEAGKGGRMEALSLGTYRASSIDINGAYPYFASKVKSLKRVHWEKQPTILRCLSADYAFAKCLIRVPENLLAGPIAVRVDTGEQADNPAGVAFPVGEFEATISKPEIELLYEMELDFKIIDGVCGYAWCDYQPLNNLMANLYHLRKYDAAGAKKLSVACVGQLASYIPQDGKAYARGAWNPVLYATIYAETRCAIYRKALMLGLENVKAFAIDGLLTTRPLRSSSKSFGGWRNEAPKGQITAITDYFKDRKDSERYRTALKETPDNISANEVTIPFQSYIGLTAVIDDESLLPHLGQHIWESNAYPLGSAHRMMLDQVTREGYLTQEIPTLPMKG